MKAGYGFKNNVKSVKMTDIIRSLTYNQAELRVQKFQCETKCEGDKVYHHPGKCPYCNMSLVEITEHKEPFGYLFDEYSQFKNF